jgi:hypothetical protein
MSHLILERSKGIDVTMLRSIFQPRKTPYKKCPNCGIGRLLYVGNSYWHGDGTITRQQLCHICLHIAIVTKLAESSPLEIHVRDALGWQVTWCDTVHDVRRYIEGTEGWLEYHVVFAPTDELICSGRREQRD